MRSEAVFAKFGQFYICIRGSIQQPLTKTERTRMRKTQRVRCVCMYVVERGDLPNETRALAGLLGCGMGLRGKRANHPRHVTGKGSHGLQSL